MERPFFRWRSRFFKLPETNFVLRLRRLYVLPSAAGMSFFVCFLVMLAASINYGMNTGFLFSFLILGYGMVAALMANMNLAYLRFSPAPVSGAVFCGEPARLCLCVENRRSSDRYAILMGFGDGLRRIDAPTEFSIAKHESKQVSIVYPTTKRGWMRFPLVQIETRFPFGLFRVWGYWNAGASVLVYPAPENRETAGSLARHQTQENGAAPRTAQFGDLAGVRSYRAGDSIRHLAWRHIAKTDGLSSGHLFAKEFESTASDSFIFDYSMLPVSMGVEKKLSRLTRWVMDASEAGLSYQLLLPQGFSEMGEGHKHREHCLAMIALFDGSQP